MAFHTQVSTACTDLQKEPHFAKGINIVGLSQGGLIGRAIVEQCNITVHNLITLGSPHMGVIKIPNCDYGFYCNIFNDAIDLGIYGSFAQNNFGPSSYYKDQYKYNEYLKKSGFLVDINNERSVDLHYTSKFKAINKLVLILFTKDTYVKPKESQHFGYYAINSTNILAYNETDYYFNDALGLKTLNNQGKIAFEYITGNHLEFTYNDIQRCVIPYLI